MTGRRLAELSITRRQGSVWTALSWGTCEECGDTLAGFTWEDGTSNGAVWDGDDLVCLDCGLVHVACLVDDDDDAYMLVTASTVEPVLLDPEDLAVLCHVVGLSGRMTSVPTHLARRISAALSDADDLLADQYLPDTPTRAMLADVRTRLVALLQGHEAHIRAGHLDAGPASSTGNIVGGLK